MDLQGYALGRLAEPVGYTARVRHPSSADLAANRVCKSRGEHGAKRRDFPNLGSHAASSGLVASPNPIAAIPFARASGKDYFRTTIFFPANFVTLLAVI